MKKTLEPTGDLMIRFTEDELSELNIKQGDKFDFKIQDDGSIKLDKYTSLELDMADWPREFLELLIKESCERDITVNEVIVETLERTVNEIHTQ
jgi:hypothetical protein